MWDAGASCRGWMLGRGCRCRCKYRTQDAGGGCRVKGAGCTHRCRAGVRVPMGVRECGMWDLDADGNVGGRCRVQIEDAGY